MPLYGLDREINRRMMAKYDPEREKEAREWIELVTEEQFPSEDFMDSLKDGYLLCKLVNTILPGSAKYKESKMPFKQMENIAAFLDAAQKKLGMPAQDLFQTIDLYEKKNPVQVIDSIHSFSRFAARAGWEGPILGPKLADKVERTFTDQQLNAGRGMINNYQYGYAGGASQGKSGVSFGGRRDITNIGSSPTSSPSKGGSSPAR